jgi:hypothetical protein
MSSSSLTPSLTPSLTSDWEITNMEKKPLISKRVKYLGGFILFLIICGVSLYFILNKVGEDNKARLAS